MMMDFHFKQSESCSSSVPMQFITTRLPQKANAEAVAWMKANSTHLSTAKREMFETKSPISLYQAVFV